MPDLDPVSERLGQLTASVENLRGETASLATKIDAVITNYASAADLVTLRNEVAANRKRVEHLEEEHAKRVASWKTMTTVATVCTTLVSLVVLFFSGAWGHLF